MTCSDCRFYKWTMTQGSYRCYRDDLLSEYKRPTDTCDHEEANPMTKIPEFSLTFNPSSGEPRLALTGRWQFEPERQAVEDHLVRELNKAIATYNTTGAMVATPATLRALEQVVADRLNHLAARGAFRELARGPGEPLAWHFDGRFKELWPEIKVWENSQ